jgi:hypothetical protein
VNGRVRRGWAAPRPTGSRRTATRCWPPPVAPETGWRASPRLSRDHYVRLDSNDYSVHPAGGQLVADHERSWSRNQVITDPEQKAAAAAMRRARVGMLLPVGPRAGSRAAQPERL